MGFNGMPPHQRGVLLVGGSRGMVNRVYLRFG